MDRQAIKTGGADERIVGGNAVICRVLSAGMDGRVRIGRQTARSGIHIKAQDSAEKVMINPPTVPVRITPSAFIPQTNVEVTIRPKMQISGIVIRGPVELLYQGHL